MKSFVSYLVFTCTGAIFSSNRPPWSCMLSPPESHHSCLNPGHYESSILYHGGGSIIGNGISGSVRSFPGFGPFPQLAVKTFATSDEFDSAQEDTVLTPQEYIVAERLKHPNIVTTYDIIFDGEYWHQIMEYFPFRLQELVLCGHLSLKQIDSTFAQIVGAVDYMHALGIAHLDLKLSNIMMTEHGIPKLIDFGSSYVFGTNNSLESSQVRLLVGEYGALSYSAPEVLDGLPYDPSLADVWALGVMYVCMTLGCPWTQARCYDESFHDFALRGPTSWLSPLPERWRSLIGMMLAIKPRDRITISEVLKALPNVSIRPEGGAAASVQVDGLDCGAFKPHHLSTLQRMLR